MTADAWLAARGDATPAELVERAKEWLARVCLEGQASDQLAAAGLEALRAALDQPERRASATDLLAADALVTLALEARAFEDPAGLGAFAVRVRRSGADFT